MRLKLLVPTRVMIDEEVSKIVAQAVNGSFGLLPRHIDFVAALEPGVLSFEPEGGGEQAVGIDEGLLVKCGDEVLVSVRNAVRGRDLATLREEIEREFLELDDRERAARSAVARLEAGTVRRFLQFGETV